MKNKRNLKKESKSIKILLLHIQIVISINTNKIIILNDTNEIRISGEESIKQSDFKEY